MGVGPGDLSCSSSELLFLPTPPLASVTGLARGPYAV